MISFLIGVIEDKGENTLALDVNGVGYQVTLSSNSLCTLPMEGETCKIWTYMAFRQDDVSLFGFSTKEERDLFNKLITVSGIGPKLAVTILSGLKISDLTIAIIKEDLKILSTIKGLGKKTAERVCLELKDKLGQFATFEESTFKTEYNEDAVTLATETLISLGINKNDAYSLVRANANKENTAEEIIAKALRGYRG